MRLQLSCLGVWHDSGRATALLHHVPSFTVVIPYIHAYCSCWCPSQRARGNRKPPLISAVMKTSPIANGFTPFQDRQAVGITDYRGQPQAADR
nr:MAG TPA: hypothetical protein [Caudoviricetes sp.]